MTLRDVTDVRTAGSTTRLRALPSARLFYGGPRSPIGNSFFFPDPVRSPLLGMATQLPTGRSQGSALRERHHPPRPSVAPVQLLIWARCSLADFSVDFARPPPGKGATEVPTRKNRGSWARRVIVSSMNDWERTCPLSVLLPQLIEARTKGKFSWIEAKVELF